MQTTEIAPGLLLTEALYDVVQAGVTAHAPALPPLTWQAFTQPDGWWLVPDRNGRISKAELTLREDRDRTVKINMWYAPDLRGPDGAPRPHSHPWQFESKILLGGYTEDRYTVHSGVVRTDMGTEHNQGDANRVDRSLYHEVRGIHTAPGHTVTLMLCGRGERGAWGYLDPATGHHTPPHPDPQFTAHLNALNPHR
ncbi:hypothetical protein [Streptomyces sp. SID3212]|uniref:hypothetical protein n=1 Tax=Streptomyces sp. SID3212 TaxID=2690259 RepID=UPI00136F7091|nr:hypothetical protein [Streptomyces sp. SID3212]MYV56465.1 hypothetical protein [Streptomyces sp. SID3212]